MIRFLFAVAVSFALALPCPASEPKMGMIMADRFQWAHGAWAEYLMDDESTNDVVVFRFAITDVHTSEVPPFAWIEVGIGPTNGAPLVTRMKVEVTGSGSGDALEAIVQFPNSAPIKVSKKHLKDKRGIDSDSSKWISVTPSPVWSNITLLGRSLHVSGITATNSEGAISSVVISSNVPPLGIVSAVGTNLQMRLTDWGSDATTSITGKPVGLLRWIWRQLRGAGNGNVNTSTSGEQPDGAVTQESARSAAP